MRVVCRVGAKGDRGERAAGVRSGLGVEQGLAGGVEVVAESRAGDGEIHDESGSQMKDHTISYTLTALTAHVSSNKVVHEWHGEAAGWDELHASAEVKSLLEKSSALVLRGHEGLKGKGASEGAK